ncbi:MAG: alpha-amylase family glycosyl hydrolase [Anaerolineaceae bacterium]|nr:alpha-amylase family glycosyl hydrolase [Anaerolineaceae bacterium]
MEFHVSRKSRDRYQFDQALFSLTGNVLFANFHGARIFTQKMNQKRDLAHFPEQAVQAGQVNAMGLIDEILHYVIAIYREQANPQAFLLAATWLDKRVGKSKIDLALRTFADEFPPLAIYRREITIEDYLQSSTDGISNRLVLLEEMLALWVANANPAFTPFGELFDDTRLTKETAYTQIIAEVHTYFDTQPFFGPDHQNLVDMLRAPAVAVPYSLTGQLEFIRERWAGLLGHYLYRLLSSLDLIREEEKAMRFQLGGGPGPVLIPRYLGTSMEGEVERFSMDREWMPTLVLIAKNAYVWLDQLSRKYAREIRHLDQIPDEELAQLTSWGFSGLWLIGLWERSQASAKIKQVMGNQDAVASAYSLARYEIAYDLGGQSSYNNLRDRAWRHGIRLASDMVPNHMGIDSDWVMQHPDWFIGQDYSPFPAYSFSGADLSTNPAIGLFIEDHYYTKSDAAVVFKRVDRGQGGREQFIYHGNDGTSTPWNDTAQLNYLNPEVREAVIQTILNVARQFPIIRFDAAMTLAKKHYQRLWFPEPGTGGDIPSRADHALSRDQFDALMPQEFWREVVDRVATEVPDTLLLAEAFWLMEGYFVRTLGMHRVYNSAFMNLLRNEDNAKYRIIMKNTLEFDPEILKRYVNFMNNPDEKTAVEQFGKGDKYFGICTLLATLPGLPMFGHGQVEGFAEKYGMEFHRAYWDEPVDAYLVERHQREIFPLLHRRRLFANVDHFLLYDFFTPEGAVNEDVYAYSNGDGNERALVVYHNRYASTAGWIRTSAAYSVKTSSSDGRSLIQRSLGEGLQLHADSRFYTVFRDHVSGLEYIRSSAQLAEQGLYVDLGAYQYHVFLNFHEVQENDWGQYGQLTSYLDGRGVPSIEEALHELFLRPVHHPFRSLVNAESFNQFLAARQEPGGKPPSDALLDDATQRYRILLGGIRALRGGSPDLEPLVQRFKGKLRLILQLPAVEQRFPLPTSGKYRHALDDFQAGLTSTTLQWVTLFGWVCVHDLGSVANPDRSAEFSRSWIDEWLLGRILAETAIQLGLDEPLAWQCVATLKALTTYQDWFVQRGKASAYQLLEAWLQDADIQRLLGVNRYQGILWYNGEAFDQFLWWLYFLAVIQLGADARQPASQVIEGILAAHALVSRIKVAATVSEFQVGKLLEALAAPKAAAGPKPEKAA